MAEAKPSGVRFYQRLALDAALDAQASERLDTIMGYREQRDDALAALPPWALDEMAQLARNLLVAVDRFRPHT